MKLLHVSAHYKADQPDGLNGSTASLDGNDLGAMFQDLRTSWDQLWREAVEGHTTDDLVRALEQQLTEIAMRRQQGSSSEEELLIAIANIDLLERVGRLKGDEFNGIMLMHADTSDAVAVPQSSPSGTASAQQGTTRPAHSARWLQFDVDAVCHEVADEIAAAGWDVDRQRLKGLPAGPMISSAITKRSRSC